MGTDRKKEEEGKEKDSRREGKEENEMEAKGRKEASEMGADLHKSQCTNFLPFHYSGTRKVEKCCGGGQCNNDFCSYWLATKDRNKRSFIFKKDDPTEKICSHCRQPAQSFSCAGNAIRVRHYYDDRLYWAVVYDGMFFSLFSLFFFPCV